VTDASAQDLIARAADYGVALSPSAAEMLCAYLRALLRKNEEINLTAVRDFEDALVRHAADGLAFGLHVVAAGAAPARVLDFGTGGGFPGVPIAVAWPASKVVLLDGTRKKIDAVRELAAEAGVTNVEARWGRAEDLLRSGDRRLRAAFDAVTARAVGPLAELVQRAGPFVAPGGALVCWKSPNLAPEEREEGLAAARRTGFLGLPDLVYASDRPSVLVRYQRRSESGPPRAVR
jgi:16S rRNA (guanine527-N7)-methyltransferase